MGTSVTITGTRLKQTTKVTFDGKSATFTVISDTEVTADVPTGAATGKIAVTTKGGMKLSGLPLPRTMYERAPMVPGIIPKSPSRARTAPFRVMSTFSPLSVRILFYNTYTKG